MILTCLCAPEAILQTVISEFLLGADCTVGFVCWTDSDGNDLHIVSPAERTMTNLVTASFTFSVSGLFVVLAVY